MTNVVPGEILNEQGDVVGEHTGFTNYTIGQRKGVGVAFPEPRYVKRINPINNSIIIAKKDAMYSKDCYASKLNWFGSPPKGPLETFARIRYNSKGTKATISLEKNNCKINFHEPQLAVTPGQSVVFYDENKLIGGGIIEIQN